MACLPALYDGAEVALKPAFGALADRIGARPVLLGGLLAFAAASAGFVLAGEPDALAAARLGQGAAAAAFSPAAPPLPRARETVLGPVRRLAQPSFVQPVAALAGATAALRAGVGLLPVRGASVGLGPLATGAAVSLLALAATLVQPRAGSAHDHGRLPARAGMAAAVTPSQDPSACSRWRSPWGSPSPGDAHRLSNTQGG